MTAPNHFRIYRDARGKHVTLDGHELLIAEDSLFIDGAESPNEVTKVSMTLLCPKITIESDVEDMA